MKARTHGGRRRALLPVAALLLAALTACGGSSDDASVDEVPAGDASAGASEATASPPDDADSDRRPDGVDGVDGVDGLPEATLPADEIAPPEGEFTEEQSDYLAERVPVGVDPGAILDLGMEACDRLGYLSRHDPAAAAPAVEAGEIPGAEGAVEHLCPEHAELLP
ncbi:hypothetical protein [Streptomyces sp. NBRC 109706]|uniref:hypothetical protein n=1 Tax=Streptomyces sp. NBRC 109706 TaxID=1550035 RepID=UPI00078027EC|nr:hypothetical protein [Streptomyces sp. NBRC 109706]